MTILLDELMQAARAASRSAYCPYSQFRVGAAVRAGAGSIPRQRRERLVRLDDLRGARPFLRP